MSSLPYYEANARAYAERSAAELPLSALREFSSLLPPGAHLLDAGCGAGRDLRWFATRGFAVEGFDGSEALLEIARAQASQARRIWRADFQLLKLEREIYDGVWAHRSLLHLPPVGVQRVLQQLFGSMRKGGVLGLAMEEGEGEREDRTDSPLGDAGPSRKIFQYPHAEMASLIRQNGFTMLKEGHDLLRPERRFYLARRMI